MIIGFRDVLLSEVSHLIDSLDIVGQMQLF